VSRDTPPAAPGAVVVDLPLTAVRPNPRQPRTQFDDEGLDGLAASIRESNGVLQPILVRRADEGRFEIVAGERRWTASRRAGLATVKAIIVEADDAMSEAMALVENMAREDLNPMEEARGCRALRDAFGLTDEQIGRRVGRGRTAINHLVRLLNLPEAVQDRLAAGELTEGHGRVLLKLDDADVQRGLARKCVAGGWSVGELNRHVTATLEQRDLAVEGVEARKHRTDVEDFMRRASDRLGVRMRREVVVRVAPGDDAPLTLVGNQESLRAIAGQLGVKLDEQE
jgi:ParB family chromosome partitioning protein